MTMFTINLIILALSASTNKNIIVFLATFGFNKWASNINFSLILLVNLFSKIDFYTFIFFSYTLFLVMFNIILFLSIFTFNFFLLTTCLFFFISLYINIYINYINLSLKNNKPGLYRLLNIGTQIVIITSFYIFSHYLLKILLDLFYILKVRVWQVNEQGPPPKRNRPNGPSGPPGGGPNNNTNVLSAEEKRKAGKKQYKKYYEDNKEKIKARNRKRYAENKDKRKASKEEYRNNHREEIRAKQREHDSQPHVKEKKSLEAKKKYELQKEEFANKWDPKKGIIATDDQGVSTHYTFYNFRLQHGAGHKEIYRAISQGKSLKGYTLQGVP